MSTRKQIVSLQGQRRMRSQRKPEAGAEDPGHSSTPLSSCQHIFHLDSHDWWRTSTSTEKYFPFWFKTVLRFSTTCNPKWPCNYDSLQKTKEHQIPSTVFLWTFSLPFLISPRSFWKNNLHLLPSYSHLPQAPQGTETTLASHTFY